jgi:hypothetical protein
VAAKVVSAAADVDEQLVGQLTGALVSLLLSVLCFWRCCFGRMDAWP